MDALELARVVAALKAGDFRGEAAEVIRDLTQTLLSERMAYASVMPESRVADDDQMYRMLYDFCMTVRCD